MNWDVWGPPLVVLSVATALGAVIAAWAVVRGEGRTARAHGEELHARKDQLIEALRELDADRGKIDEGTWAARREALLTDAADTLRALEAPPKDGPAPAPPASKASTRGLLWASGVAVFFAALAALLVNGSKPRAQGESMTGGMDQGTDAPDPEEVAARATLEKSPNDLDALNTMTWLAIRAQDLPGAMSFLEKARKQNPHDPYVLTHLAILSMRVGMADRADASLAEALDQNPGLPRALLFRGLLRFQTDDRAGAEVLLTEVLNSKAASAEERQMASAILAEVKRPPAQDRLRGSVSLADGVKVPDGGLLFIIARRTAVPGGPPVAAVRQPGPSFPYAFTVTDENMMLGGAWPDEVWVQARLDSDGDPTTKADTDVESVVIGPLKSGTADISLVLGAH